MSKATFKNIVVMTVPGDITPDELIGSLNDLVTEVERGGVSDVLVDVSRLSKDDDKLKRIGEETGPRARMEIDPKLKSHVKKIAFVSPSGNYHGRDEKALEFEGPILSKGAPAKHYFTDHTAAINWLHI